MEIGPDSSCNRDLEKEKQKIQKGKIEGKYEQQNVLMKNIEKETIKSDSIQKRQLHHIPLKQSEEMHQPLLQTHTSRFARMNDAIINVRQEFDLPSPNSLRNQLSAKIQGQIQNIMNESGFASSSDPKIQNFFDILSRLIPLGASLLQGLSSDDHALNLPQLRASMMHMLRETGALIIKHSNSSVVNAEEKLFSTGLSNQLLSLPQDGKHTKAFSELLQSILGNAITPNTELNSYTSIKHFIDEINTALLADNSTISISHNRQLFSSLVNADLLPPSILDKKIIDAALLKSVKTELEDLQANSSEVQEPKSGTMNKPMAPTIGFLATFLSNIAVFPENTQAAMIKIMISTQPVLTDNLSNRLLGPHTMHFAHTLSCLAVDLSKKLELIPDHPAHIKSASEYFTRIFASLIITASILGRLEVDRGDGKAMSLEDEVIGKVQRMAAKELNIHDLPPFSFFALWAPFVNLQDGHHREHKEAALAISEFMRSLMRLIYLLVSIYTSGHKLGEDGIDVLLEENQIYILTCLDNLDVSLKTLNEKFGVNVMSVIERCVRSKHALLSNNYPEFWHNIFRAFKEKSNLKDFLDEVDLIDHLYHTIRTLISGSGFNTSAVKM